MAKQWFMLASFVIFGIVFGLPLAATAQDPDSIETITAQNLPLLGIIWQTPESEDFNPIHALAFHPDSKTLAAAIFPDIVILDSQTGAEVQRLSGTGSVNDLAFNADGSLLAAASGNRIHLWDMATGETVFIGEGHRAVVNAVDFHPDGKHLISASDDNTLIIWDLETQSSVKNLESNTFEVNDVQYSPTGDFISGSTDGRLYLWNGEVLAPRFTLDAGGWQAVAFSPDGQLAVGGDGGGSLVGLNSDDGSILYEQSTASWIYDLAFSSDGTLLAAAQNGATLLAAATGETLFTLPCFCHSVAFSPDGYYLATGNNQNGIQMWQVLPPAEPTPTPTPSSVKTAPELQISQEWQGHSSGFTLEDIDFSADGRFMVSTGRDKVIVWDSQTADILTTLVPPDLYGVGEPSCICYGSAISPDSKWVAVNELSQIYLLQADTWEVTAAIAMAEMGGDQDQLFFSPDGRQLVVIRGVSSTITVLSIPDGEVLKTFNLEGLRLVNAFYAASGQLAVVVSPDFSVIYLDPISFEQTSQVNLNAPTTHPEPSTARLSPDGQTLVSIDYDHNISWIAADTGRLLHQESLNINFVGMGWSAGMALAPSGDLLATYHSDGSLILWDMTTYTPMARVDEGVSLLAFSADGNRLATLGYDSTIRIWGVP